jgi:hypothetical protein
MAEGSRFSQVSGRDGMAAISLVENGKDGYRKSSRSARASLRSEVSNPSR